MIRHIALLIFALMLCEVAWPQQKAQHEEKPDEFKVITVGTSLEVFVDLKFNSPDFPILILYCAKFWDGTQYLCPLQGTDLEVQTSLGWEKVKQRTIRGVLSPPRRDLVLSTLLEPNRETIFTFEFSRADFEVDPGQKLRVVVDAWHDEQSMKNGDEPIKLYSEPFECPDIGIIP